MNIHQSSTNKKVKKNCKDEICLYFDIVKLFIIIIFFQILLLIYQFYCKGSKIGTDSLLEHAQYKDDNITLVSAFYLMKSKYSAFNYIQWLENLMKINNSLVFFTDKAFMKVAKYMRPKELYNKTIFIELEMKDFYSYKNFGKLFEKAFQIDNENFYHTIPLYLIWAEKCTFLKKVIEKNYFNSKCFYWIDSGYFRKNDEMNNYINGWPSPEKCYEDDRVLINLFRNFSAEEIKGIINFEYKALIKLINTRNVGGGMFGGQPEKLLNFIDLYYKSVYLFAEHKLFIGKDQNIFAYISFSHPEIVKLVYSNRNYLFFKKYLS